MSKRLERLRLLADELLHEMRQLASSVTSGGSLVFLDRLARCESFPPEELAAAGVQPLVEAAAQAREREAGPLGEWGAAGLDLEGLLDQGYRLAGGTDEEGAVVRWAWDLLLVANVTPYLEEPASSRAASLIEDVVDLIEANASAFLEAAAVAADREEHEHPERILDTLGADLLRAFAAAPDLAAYDAEQPAASDHGALERLLQSLPKEQLTEASDAIRRARGWAAEVVELRSAAREVLAGKTSQGPQEVRFAAEGKTYGVGEHVLLRRIEAGELLLTREGGALFLDWYGEGEPTAAATYDGARVELAPLELDGGRRWLLPATEAELRIEATLGPNRIELVLPR